MRILHVNKFLHVAGGSETYMFGVADRQEAAGHQIAFFGMTHPHNRDGANSDLGVDEVSLDPPPDGTVAQLRTAGRIVWNRQAQNRMAEMIGRFRPDVVHAHNIYHQLSPSILRPVRAAGIPAVMTLHDYKLVCPTYLLRRQGKVCESCIDGGFRQAAKLRCQGSLAGSALLAFETGLHRRIGAYDPIDLLICPSRFLAGRMEAGGIDARRLRHLPNFSDLDQVAQTTAQAAEVFYAGRLSDEKGVATLVEAAGLFPQSVKVTVAGGGPLEEELRNHPAAGRIDFLGRIPHTEVLDRLGGGPLVVVPSACHENAPMVALEAMAAGAVVVASDRGGLPEQVRHGQTGLIFPADDPAALAGAVGRLLADPELRRAMAVRAREDARRQFSAEVHMERLHELYGEALRMHGRA
ncbi:MAG: glycosyltransferase family 4 protein [Actinomycetia bacterium]|nr:glycosyltransferase family 4 protein [Actinomycetes bacterium]